jgi:tetratricopeptide (TPR) repeat protein
MENHLMTTPRTMLVGLLVLCSLVAALPAGAQEATPTPFPTVAVPQQYAMPDALATQVYENAQKAANAAEDSQRYAEEAAAQVSTHLDTANDLLGLFQNVTAISGLLIPLLALLGALLGFNRLNEAQKELEDAKKKLEKEMAEKREELQRVREEMESSINIQRENAAKTNIAASLLSVGERQYRSQDHSGAISSYQRALELDPNSLITHHRLGYVYTHSGNLQQAYEHLTRALEIEPNFPPALACLGYVNRKMGEKMPAGIEREQKFNYAESLLLGALSISPKLIDEDGEAWWGSLGGLYRRRGQINEAIEAYKKAAEATPQSSYAYGNLALLYAQTKNVNHMLDTYKRVEQLAWGEVQSNIDNYYGFADLLTSRLALGKVQAAEDALESVLRTAPVDAQGALESLLETLNRLQSILGESRANHIPTFIKRIQAQHEANKAAKS